MFQEMMAEVSVLCFAQGNHPSSPLKPGSFITEAAETVTGGLNPSEKWWSSFRQLGWWYSQYMGKYNVPNHQPELIMVPEHPANFHDF